jgi:hypothetical protein
MKYRRKFYGWLRGPGCYCIGRNPPDLPTLPYVTFASIGEAEQAAHERKADVIWSGAALAEKERKQKSRLQQENSL